MPLVICIRRTIILVVALHEQYYSHSNALVVFDSTFQRIPHLGPGKDDKDGAHKLHVPEHVT